MNNYKKSLLLFLFLSLTLARCQPYHNPAPSQIKSITLVVTQLCNHTLDIDYQEIRKRWYGASSYSVEGFMSTCSLGKTNFIESNNPILYGLKLPCVGITKYGLYQSHLCKVPELYGWIELAQGLATAMGYNMDLYPIKIIVFPLNLNCTFSGLATPSCSSGKCYVWINMFKGLDTSFVMHEISHTLGLMHSSISTDPYGDFTCAMGNGTHVCFNAPQSWKLGWRDAIANFNGLTLQSGNSLIPLSIYSLIPFHNMAYNSFIRILKGNTSYFISIRGGPGASSRIFDNITSLGKYYNTLSIHVTNGTESDFTPVFLLGNIGLNQSIYIPALGACIKFNNLYYNFANVSLSSGACKNESMYCNNLRNLMKQYCEN